MKKFLYIGLGLALFLAGTITVFAQSGGGDNGKTYYDAEKTKPKEVFSYKEVYKFDPTNPQGESSNSKVKHGPYFYYYESGKLKISGQYRDNLKHGEWKYFDERGTQTKTEKYESGRLIQ